MVSDQWSHSWYQIHTLMISFEQIQEFKASMCSLTQTGRKGVSAKEHLTHKTHTEGQGSSPGASEDGGSKWEEET